MSLGQRSIRFGWTRHLLSGLMPGKATERRCRYLERHGKGEGLRMGAVRDARWFVTPLAWSFADPPVS